jgi:microcystin-dependent protein
VVRLRPGNVVQVVYSATQGNFHTAIPPAGTPPGSVLEYAGTTAPVGYLMATGQAVSRTAYAKLFAAIGTTFGVGDGSTTFNVPDRRGRVSVGTDGGSGRLSTIAALANIGGIGGEQQHTLSIAEMPVITPTGSVTVSYPAHTYSLPTQSVGVAGGTGATVFVATTTPSSTSPPGPQSFGLSINGFGSGNAHNVVQPSIAMNFIIKY